MNSRRKVLRTVLLLILATVLLYSAFPAQVDSLGKLSGPARMIYGHNDTHWKGNANAFRSDAFSAVIRELYEFDASGDQPMLGVSAVVRDEGQELRASGYRILAQIGDVVTMNVPVASLPQIAALESVIHVSASKIDRPLWHDVSVSETRAVQARQSFNLSGQNVVVGIIDTGIDWKHDDFRRPDGKTRIKFLWDMSDKTGPEPPELGGTGGTVYTEQQINDALAGTGAVAEADRVGHGTHVAGSAAGNGRGTGNGFAAGTYMGMAPEADLVVVKAMRSDSGGFSENDEIAAMQFIDSRAQQLGKPYVINMSLGGHVGPHDGTSSNERAIDNLVGSGKPGKVICISAGNEGASDIHASGTISQGASQALRFSVRSQSTVEAIDIWYPGSDSIDLILTTPGGASTPSVSPSNSFSGTDPNSGTLVEIQSSTNNPLNNAKNIIVVLSKDGQAIASGTWTLQLRRTAGSSGRFDAWMAKNSRFLDRVDPSGHVGMPGTARNAITVASYITKYRWTDVDGISRDYSGWGPAFDAAVFAKSPFSSAGPTRDGRLKPEIAAPGQAIASTLSADADEGREMIVRDGKHVIMQGTSMSSPHVTGAVALMLQASATLDASQVRDILAQTARTDDFTARVPNYDFGYGKMDVYEAIRKIRGNPGTPPALPAPVITAVEPNAIQRGTSTQVAITGLNFSGSLALDFSPSAGISVNSAGIASTTKISLNLNVSASAAIGAYQVYVTTDGRRSNPGTFRIIAPDTPSPDTQDPYESNDNLETAKPMPNGGRISARINPKTDLDVFKFSALAGKRMSFDIDAATLTPPSNLDSILGVFDQYGNLLDFNDDDGRTLDSLLEWTPGVTGTYYVAVASYSSDESGPSSTGNYVLKISGYAGDIRGDTTAPTLESSQIEAPNYIGKTNELFASWQGIDPESGIDHYEFSVGSAPGSASVLPWTRTSRDSVYLGGLNLVNGNRYYFSVRAFNGSGLSSPTAYSPGTSVDTNLRNFPLYFPRVVAFPGTFTGLALVNTGIPPAQVIFKLYDNDGNLSLDAGVKNPTVRTLNSREQLPVLSTQLFSIPSSNSPGWVKVESNSPDVQGFYLYGSNDLAFLDGTEVSTKTLTDFVFHRIEELGSDVFTNLNLVNPGETDAAVTLDLRNTAGQVVSSQSLTLQARRRLVKTITDLFPSAGRVQGGTVRVRSSVGLVGFELFTSNAVDVGGMSPQPTSSTASQVVFAQLASMTGWYTKISLTNPNTTPVNVELIARSGEGGQVKTPVTVTIPAWGQYNGDAVDVFGFPPGSQVTGYITARVVGGSGGIFGHVVFGTTAGAIAALPIQTQGTRGMVFSQVAQDNTYFTGLTLMNPSTSASANVRVEVFDASGGVLGSSDQIGDRWPGILPGERRAKLIHEIVPGVLGRSAGYIVVTSDQPIIGFELFGGVTSAGQIPFLAAVPPQPLSANPAMATAVPAQGESRQIRPSRDLGSLYLKMYNAIRKREK